MFDVANHVFATVAGHLQPIVTKQRHRYYYLFYFILFYLTPVLNSQGMKKNFYAMQYKKVQKSSWNETYSSSSFTKQSCSKMAPAPSVQHRKEK